MSETVEILKEELQRRRIIMTAAVNDYLSISIKYIQELENLLGIQEKVVEKPILTKNEKKDKKKQKKTKKKAE